jgi:hypothetical protein
MPACQAEQAAELRRKIPSRHAAIRVELHPRHGRSSLRAQPAVRKLSHLTGDTLTFRGSSRSHFEELGEACGPVVDMIRAQQPNGRRTVAERKSRKTER